MLFEGVHPVSHRELLDNVPVNNVPVGSVHEGMNIFIQKLLPHK